MQTHVPLYVLLISVNGSTIYLELGLNSLGWTMLQLSKYSPFSVLEQRLLPHSIDLGLVHRSYFEQRNGHAAVPHRGSSGIVLGGIFVSALPGAPAIHHVTDSYCSFSLGP